MAGKRFTAEQIIMKRREAEVGLAQGQKVAPGPAAKLPRPQEFGSIPRVDSLLANFSGRFIPDDQHQLAVLVGIQLTLHLEHVRCLE